MTREFTTIDKQVERRRRGLLRSSWLFLIGSIPETGNETKQTGRVLLMMRKNTTNAHINVNLFLSKEREKEGKGCA